MKEIWVGSCLDRDVDVGVVSAEVSGIFRFIKNFDNIGINKYIYWSFLLRSQSEIEPQQRKLVSSL